MGERRLTEWDAERKEEGGQVVERGDEKTKEQSLENGGRGVTAKTQKCEK